jgi:hypothetical protein
MIIENCEQKTQGRRHEDNYSSISQDNSMKNQKYKNLFMPNNDIWQ